MGWGFIRSCGQFINLSHSVTITFAVIQFHMGTISTENDLCWLAHK